MRVPRSKESLTRVHGQPSRFGIDVFLTLVTIGLLLASLPHVSAQTMRRELVGQADTDGFGRANARIESFSRHCAHLAIIGDALPGTRLTFDLTEGIPESLAVLAVSLAEGTTRIDFGSFGMLELGLASPIAPVPMGLTDQAGNASIGFTVPSGVPQLPEVFVQALSANFGIAPVSAGPQTSGFCTSEVQALQVSSPVAMARGGNGNGKGNGGNNDGGQDPGPGFGADGFVILPIQVGSERDYGSDVAVQADGKMLVSIGTTGFDTDAVIARFDSAGVLDSTYGTDGLFIFDLGGFDKFDRIEIQSDGKALALGMTGVSSSAADDYLLVRVNTDGTLDTSYGNNGHVIVEGRNEHTENVSINDIGELRVDSNGNAVVVRRSGLDSSGDEDVHVSRYTPDGQLDVSFGVDGTVILDHTVSLPAGGTSQGQSRTRNIGIQDDGKIVLAYRSTAFSVVTRLDTDGSLDSSFGTNGSVFLDPSPIYNSSPYGLVVTSDAILPVAKSKGDDDGIFDVIVWRLDMNGNLDPNFGDNGLARQDSGGDDQPWDAIMDLNGDLRIAGESRPTNGTNPCPTAGKVWRLDPMTGIFGTTFVFNVGDPDSCKTGNGKNGRATGTYETLRGLAIHADGSVAVTGGSGETSSGLDTALGIIDSVP